MVPQGQVNYFYNVDVAYFGLPSSLETEENEGKCTWVFVWQTEVVHDMLIRCILAEQKGVLQGVQ